MVKGIRIQDEQCEVPRTVKIEVKKCFQNRLTETSGKKVTLNNMFPTLSEDYNVILARRFSEEEIKKEVQNCESTKSPGPTGLNFSFIKFSQDIIKD